MPSPENPLTGGCACGAVRYEVTAPFSGAGYCHCHRCQRRSGALWSTNAWVSTDAFAITQGAEEIRAWQPEDGLPKAFCVNCGGHVFGGDLDGPVVGVRLGTVDGDPGIRPQFHAWLESAPEWDPVPEDGLQRSERHRPR